MVQKLNNGGIESFMLVDCLTQGLVLLHLVLATRALPSHKPAHPPCPSLRLLGPRHSPCLILTFVLSHAGSINLDNLQSLSSDNATMAMQQAMMAAHDDSLDGTEEEDEDDMEEEEEEEEELEEEADELQTTNVSDLGLEHSDSLE